MHEILEDSMVEWPRILDGYEDQNFKLTGCVSIDGEQSFNRHSNEFKAMMDRIGSEVGIHDGNLHYIFHVVAGDECQNDYGDVVQGHMRLYFLISNKIGPLGTPTCVTSENLWFMIHGLWPHKIHYVKAFNAEIDDGVKALHWVEDDGFFTPRSKLTASTDLLAYLLLQEQQTIYKE